MVSQDVEPYGERKREHFPFRGTIEIDMRQVIAILQVDNRIHKLGRHRYLASLILFKFLSKLRETFRKSR